MQVVYNNPTKYKFFLTSTTFQKYDKNNDLRKHLSYYLP